MPESKSPVQVVSPGNYRMLEHFYPRVPNAQLHPLVRHFMRLGNERIAARYCHLHPQANADAVRDALAFVPRYLRWAGADLFHATTEFGDRRNVVVEVNSSPSGQKSMPLLDDEDEYGGYRRLLERTFLPMLKRRSLPEGRLAVLWDKNEMEVSGYAAALADLTDEPVLQVYTPPTEEESVLRVTNGVIEVHESPGQWTPIRGALRYVTQRPWTRIPPVTRTAMMNPVVACLAGGRNKLLAAKAYDFENAQLAESGLSIQVPETVWDVGHAEVPFWVTRMGGRAVVKNPYSNAGQGVWTLTSARELHEFMHAEQRYERYIVQQLIGNSRWSSRSARGSFYHIGTIPGLNSEIYVADLRVMVGASQSGFFPVALYARRARDPLASKLSETTDSWRMLGTNLSVRTQEGWGSDSSRLMLMDRRDFNRLGLGSDDLIESYIQTVLAITAIDNMASRLITKKGVFRHKLFASINPDDSLCSEIMH